MWQGESGQDGSQQIGLIGVADGLLRLLKSLNSNKVIRVGGFSPDGKYIVYQIVNFSGFRGAPSKAYILSTDGKSDVPLSSEAFISQGPVWTPDGSRIVFVSDRGGSSALWSVRVVDGKPLGDSELVKSDFSNCYPSAFVRDGSLFCSVY